jgi:UDP-N-acetylglucosamine 2-epimerase
VGGWLKVGRQAGRRFIYPLGHLDMLMLEQHARLILTDSDGVQKEAYFFTVPCVTLRPETECAETVETGWNLVLDADRERVVRATYGHYCCRSPLAPYLVMAARRRR